MKVIIDCDPGNGVPGANVDDGLALSLAIATGRLDVEAITVVTGNTPRDTGFAVAQTLLEDAGADIPLYLGADRALVEKPRKWRAYLDRDLSDPAVSGMWESTPVPRAAHDAPSIPAAQVIGERVRAVPGEITVVAIGPLTNIALAMRLYPDFADKVGGIVVMGGVFDVDGYLVDTNFGFDPEAAAIVMASGANITLVPMDVTTRTLLTHRDLDRIERFDNRLTRSLVPTVRPWVSYSETTRAIGGMWIHDVLAVALLLDPTLVTSRPYTVTVDIAPGLARGRSVRWTPGAQRQRRRLRVEPAPVDVVVDVDNDRLLDLITDSLRAYV